MTNPRCRACSHSDCPLRSPDRVPDLAFIKCLVVDARGRLVWLAPAWEFSTATHDLQGFGWQEFIHPDDSPSVSHWLANRESGRISFRLCAPREGGTEWFLLALEKQRFCGCCWIAAGESEPISEQLCTDS